MLFRSAFQQRRPALGTRTQLSFTPPPKSYLDINHGVFFLYRIVGYSGINRLTRGKRRSRGPLTHILHVLDRGEALAAKCLRCSVQHLYRGRTWKDMDDGASLRPALEGSPPPRTRQPRSQTGRGERRDRQCPASYDAGLG